MIDEPKLMRTAAEQTAVIRLNIARAEMRKVMGPAMAEVREVLREQNVRPTGPMFARHLTLPPGRFDFEVGVTVPAPIQEQGRVRPGELATMDVAYTVYRGPYDGLPGAWRQFDAWLSAKGIATTIEFIERYATGPADDPDPENWCTELLRLLY